MTNLNTIAGATAPKTLPYGVNSRPELTESTQLAVGSAAVWPEESEPAISQKICEIAKNDKEGKVNHHVPEMVWFHKFEDTSTVDIRKTLGLQDAERGRRILHITIFRKLDPITDLSEDEFLGAWWHIVVCHYTLWDKKVLNHHHDINPSNLMVYKASDGRFIGVLNDFDLSSTRDSPSGQERTGTIAFMAIELLSKEGTDKHLYRHNAELFIWVLTWVCLRYQKGRLLNKGRQLDWLQVDAIKCRKEKCDFLYSGRNDIEPSPSHLKNWDFAQFCLDTLGSHYAVRSNLRLPLEDHIVFETWLENQIHHSKRLGPGHSAYA
ncbi:hypothetical protein BD769DRAFT_856656 [Suillus cothurnatus]|nr:hypothetical protein BD769DRAFT_856656 [Suillus cothurnatus]